MGKRKLDEGFTALDLVSSSSSACQQALPKRITRQAAQDIRSFEQISPCFLGAFPRWNRSQRRANLLGLRRNLWRDFSEDKKTTFTYLDCLWFVLDIHKADGRPENKELISRIPLLVPKVPQQRNEVDCGIFVLYFINLFMESAPENFSISEGYPYFMKKNWFSPEGLESFSKKVQSLCR
ncbi:hypothetical protein HHK36_029498 [Tetracentron sinense]|uniref:Ubiquitin-like protease family profile domain-containing protein n=1 Tax=Tetracentron sinense TaxID=13715 RepID=A0A835D1U7_TETSI|nr:hypothetical protein HHK36_029498 [Tetracentron sinense]